LSAIDRVPPHDLEAEQALLGAVLLAPSTLDKVSDLVKWQDFYRPAHQLIFEQMVDMRGRGVEIDAISLRDALDKNNTLDSAGGVPYLIDLQGVTPTTANAKRYAAIVREKAMFRQLIFMGTKLVAVGYDAEGTAEDAVAVAMDYAMGMSIAQTTATLPIGTVAKDLVAMLRLGKQDFIYPWLLPWVHIKSKELVVIGAAPSVGKTAISIALADEWSKTTRVAYFEYEMSEADLVARLACKHSGVSIEDMENGLSETQMALVQLALDGLATRNLYVEAVTCDINGLLGKIRREAQRGTKVVFIDHLGLIPFKIPANMNHAKAVGSVVTNRLKRLAMELDIVIVLLSQINRGGSLRGGIPRKDDLRDSGEIEADADKIIMLGREPLMMEDAQAHVRFRQDHALDPFADDAKDFTLVGIGVVKYRNGALGEKWTRFYGASMSYTDVHPVISQSATTAKPTNNNEQERLLEHEGEAEPARRVIPPPPHNAGS
jgi:replicative DNA helicase